MLRALERQVCPVISGIHAGHVERYKFAARKVRGSVLDAACGCGYGASLLGKDVTGIDLEPEAIAYAAEHYPGPTYVVDDVTKHRGSYDWVVSLETIEHVPEPGLALQNFRGVGEKLIISTPNQERFPYRPEQYAGDTFPHLRHYTPCEFDELLNDCGWNVLERWCQVEKISPVTPGTHGKFLIYVCS